MAAMRKIKVWAGEHPDELAALGCTNSLETQPIPNVSPGIANPLAHLLGRRWVDMNMAFAFPGDLQSLNYEERRAVDVLQESSGYYAVVSLHNFPCFGQDIAYIDPKRGVSSKVLGLLSNLGLRNLILFDNSRGLQRFAANALILETRATGLGGDIAKLRDAFDELANDPDPTEANASDFRWFRHLTSPHIDQLDPMTLTAGARRRLLDFEPLPDAFAALLGFEGVPVYLTSWRYAPNEYGYWGETATPVATPDDSLWPQ